MGLIEISGLTKSYGENRGVFDLTFEIAKGEVFGYLGPNGAGKTTTIRHLLGFLNPDSGGCLIDGMDCRRRAAEIQRRIGYLPGEIAFLEDMTGTRFLKFMADMRGLTDFTRRDELLARFELDARGGIRKMSKGMKQKLGIVCAFMHEPETLILDEPTSGLDPLMRTRFVELILEEKARGRTILMSSHSFEEVERTCGRIGIIRLGRLAAVENIADLQSAQRKVYAVTLADAEEARRFSEDGVQVLSIRENTVNVAVSGDIGPFIAAMSGHRVTGLDVVTQTLEDLFMHYYGPEGAR